MIKSLGSRTDGRYWIYWLVVVGVIGRLLHSPPPWKTSSLLCNSMIVLEWFWSSELDKVLEMMNASWKLRWFSWMNFEIATGLSKPLLSRCIMTTPRAGNLMHPYKCRTGGYGPGRLASNLRRQWLLSFRKIHYIRFVSFWQIAKACQRR